MKIGILTVYSFNYGSFFQATSLYKELEALGHEVEFINEKFKKYKWGNLFALYTFDSIMPAFAKNIIANVLPQYRTYLKLKNDVSKYKESSSKNLSLKKLSKEYDLIILGADEMWSASPKSIRYTKEHFGYDINCPHISYATCGSLFDLNDDKLKEKASKGLKTFKSILVRDEYTSKVVKELTDMDADVVLDPTLLNPYFIEQKADNNLNDSYVLLYGQHYSEEQKEYILNKAKELNCSIKAIGWPIDFADEFLDPDSASDFQKCFADATFAFPSTFHGTIFSVLNHVQFLSMVNSLRGKKIKMLLEDINMTDRIFDSSKKEYGYIDYVQVEKNLQEKREKCRNMLVSHINDALK